MALNFMKKVMESNSVKNPFGGPKTVVNEKADTPAAKPAVNPFAKNPFAKKTVAPASAPVEEKKDEAAAVEPAEVKLAEVETTEVKTTEVETTKETAKEEAPKKRRKRRTKQEMEEAKKAAADDSVDDAEEETEEEDEEEEKVADTPASNSNKSDKVLAAKYGNVDILGMDMTYDDAAALVLSQFTTDNWNEFEDNLTKQLTDIRIEADMNAGTLKEILADLDCVKTQTLIPLIQNRKLVEALGDKDWGALRALKKANSSGSNVQQREANGLLALTKADIGGQTINYIAVITAAKMRLVFLEAINNLVDYKRSTCITMSAGLKIEAQTDFAS